MKNSILKLVLLSFFLLNDFILFAQDPGDTGDGDGGLEGGDPAAAPIDGKLIFLGISAILFAIYTFSKKRQQT
jgi:hypothetical protein